MNRQKYSIKLTDEQCKELKQFMASTSKKNTPQNKTHAKVLLYLDENGEKKLTPKQTATKCKFYRENIYKIRKQYHTQGIDRVLQRKKREAPPIPGKITGEIEARIIATACSTVSEGKKSWTLQMIANKIVLDGVVESIFDVTVMRVLKKTQYKPHLKKMWCIPPQQDADFVSKMEDVLDIYTLSCDKSCPVICFDEKPYQLLDECREPLSMKVGGSVKVGNEYEWMGMCCVFVMCGPLLGWHHADARAR